MEKPPLPHLDNVYFPVYTFVGGIQMTHTVTLKELRPQLPRIANAVERKLDRYIVTRHGKPVMTILSPDDYEGLLETIEILSDRSALRRIKKSMKQAREGKTSSWEMVKRRLDQLSA